MTLPSRPCSFQRRLGPLFACLGMLPFLAPLASAQQKGGFVAGKVDDKELAVLDANNYLSEGDQFLRQGKLKDAVGYYRAAVDLLPPGDRVGGIRATAADRYARAATKYAQELINQAHPKEAKVILQEILTSDRVPHYEPAEKMLGKIADPDWVRPSDTPAHRAKVNDVDQLLREANTVLHQGKLDDASAKYSEVLNIDRFNSAAREGLARVAEFQRASSEAARDHARAEMLTDLDSKWALGKPRSLGIGAKLDDAGMPENVGQSEDVARKLRSIYIDQVDFQEVSLEQAVAFVVQRGREIDPDKKGVDIVLGNDPGIERNRPISLRLNHVPLLEVIRYITDQVGARFLIEPGAVRIAGLSTQDNTILTRRFKVGPDFFQGGSAAAAAAPTNIFGPDAGASAQPTVRRVSAEDFLKGNGVSFPEGASATYLAGSSTMIVRNTYNNLQLVEQLVSSSQQESIKQLYVEVRMIDTTQTKLAEIGFDWLLGDFDLRAANAVKFGGVQAVSPEVASTFAFRDPTTGEAFGGQRVTGGLRSGTDAVGLDGLDQIINVDRQGGLVKDTTGPGIFSFNGKLTDPQFQAVIRGLNQQKGVDVVVEPKVVTKSGNRAKIFIGEELLYPTEFDPPELPQQVAAEGAGIPVTPAHPTTFKMRPVGFTMEVEPTIGPDNYTIDISLAAEFTEFEGFVNYGSPISVSGTDALGSPLELLITQNQILQPVFRSRKLPSSNVSVYDGSTLVIGSLMDSRVDKVLDRIPIVGDLPWIGSLFRSNLERKRDRALVFFLTSRIVDTSGAPVRGRTTREATTAQAQP